MGQETIDELLDMADESNHTRLSHSAMLRLALVFIKENLQETRKLNGSIKETMDRVDELERYPSLTALIRRHPRQMLIALVVFFVFIHVVTDFHLVAIITDYVRMFM